LYRAAFEAWAFTLRVSFFGFEATDPSGFFKYRAAIFGAGRKHTLDFALLDQAVGVGSNSGSSEDRPDVFKPSSFSVDQILGFATAINPACDVDLFGVVSEDLLGVVQNDRCSCRVGGATGVGSAGTFEDHVGHVFAAQTFCALLTKDPLDGVDDVRFSRSVGTDHDGDPGWKFESSFVSEALKPTEFKSF